jgi:hypothetical protein
MTATTRLEVIQYRGQNVDPDWSEAVFENLAWLADQGAGKKY